MHKLGIHRTLRQLTLDAMFVALLAHFFVTGHVVPPALIDLLRDEPQVVAISPVDSPGAAPEAAPIHNESPDETPDT